MHCFYLNIFIILGYGVNLLPILEVRALLIYIFLARFRKGNVFEEKYFYVFFK